MVNSQKYINQNYPREKRIEIIRLHANKKYLEGNLDLNDFVNLEELYCSHNLLTKIDFSDCPNLRVVNCSNNKRINLNPSKCTSLQKLSCEDNELTKIDLSSCSNLKELYCHSNQLIGLDFLDMLSNPEKLTYLNISNNKFPAQDLSFLRKFTSLRKLFISNNEFFGSLKFLKEMSNLEELDISDTNINEGLEWLSTKTLKKIHCEMKEGSELLCKFIAESLKKYYNSNEKVYNYKNWVANELIKNYLKEKEEWNSQKEQLEGRIDFLENELSRIKNSTSNIRNILLIGKTGNGKSALANVITGTDKFKEGKYAVSETRNVQKEEFKHEGINYRIVDTVGIGDTKLTEEQVLDKIAEAAYSVRNGLHQILFVTSGRFDQDEIIAYDLPRKAIFDENINQFITIVRTNFPDFENKEECQKDIEAMSRENEELSEIIKSCNKVIHVENYPKTANSSDDSHSERTRDSSRNVLLNHLATCQEVYKPQHLQGLNRRICPNMNKKEQIEWELIDLKSQSQLVSENESLLIDGRIEVLKKELEKELESIRQATKEHITEKGINWEKWIKLGIQGTSSMVSIAAVVVAAACKIM